MVSQHVRFCTSADGVRIAYAITGSGPILVRAPHWLTHIEHDWNIPVRRHWIESISAHFTLVRFDQRACGLSDRAPADVSLDSFVADLEAVVSAAKLERFALLGASQGGAVAIEYAVRHPEQVDRLVLYGAFGRGKMARGNPVEREDALAQLKLVELGWGSDDPTYRNVFASQLMPGGSREAQASLSAMMRISTTPADAVRLTRMVHEIDVMDAAGRIACPTLVMHCRGDRRIPHAEGRLLATLVQGARFVTLESINHMLPPEDPAWPEFIDELRAFVPGASRTALAELSEREREILDELARGLDNAMIASHLGITDKTVRNHLTRIYEKLQVRRRGEAIVRAREAGLGLPRPGRR